MVPQMQQCPIGGCPSSRGPATGTTCRRPSDRSSLFLLCFSVVTVVLFSVVSCHLFLDTLFRFRPLGDTDHLIAVGLPPVFPAALFLATAALFCPFDILSATALGRHAGYFLLDLLADLRPQGLPVATSLQSSLNHLVSPPLGLATWYSGLLAFALHHSTAASALDHN